MAPALTKLYNYSRTDSYFPASLKSPSVIYTGEHSHPSNYRRITLLTLVGKADEALINAKGVKYFTSHVLLTD